MIDLKLRCHSCKREVLNCRLVLGDNIKDVAEILVAGIMESEGQVLNDGNILCPRCRKESWWTYR